MTWALKVILFHFVSQIAKNKVGSVLIFLPSGSIAPTTAIDFQCWDNRLLSSQLGIDSTNICNLVKTSSSGFQLS